jgi:hypothetical protein
MTVPTYLIATYENTLDCQDERSVAIGVLSVDVDPGQRHQLSCLRFATWDQWYEFKINISAKVLEKMKILFSPFVQKKIS